MSNAAELMATMLERQLHELEDLDVSVASSFAVEIKQLRLLARLEGAS
ncbi:MAG: hypothetical protein AAGB04_13265 [Pseudomonadota bacterium]